MWAGISNPRRKKWERDFMQSEQQAQWQTEVIYNYFNKSNKSSAGQSYISVPT